MLFLEMSVRLSGFTFASETEEFEGLAVVLGTSLLGRWPLGHGNKRVVLE